MANGAPREQWASRLGMILAVAGSAVGLGNFLRFPGQAAQNGGGAFMIPYFCALIFLGIPICWAEWTMGKYGGQFGFNSCPAIVGVLGRRPIWRYLGVLGLLIPIVIYMYYILIESWCLGYAWSYLTGSIDLGPDQKEWVANSAKFYGDFVGSSAHGALLDGRMHPCLIFWVITFTLNFYYIYRGLSKGIEKFCSWAMPAMAVCALIVLLRVLTLGTPDPSLPDQSVLTGLGFMWNPKSGREGASWLSVLWNPQAWLSAAGQIFFSLSVGFGVIVNYASYLRRKDDIVLSGLTASATNEFFEVCLGGLITIPAAVIFLGTAALLTDKGTVQGTFDLGFKTLPVVFLYMPWGRLFGFLWFFMLFLAAITSSLSMLQPAIAFLEEGLNIGRKASVTLLGMITGMGSLFVIYFSGGLGALSALDDWVGTAMIVVLATVQVILYSWVFGAKKGHAFASEGAEMKLPRGFNFVIKYVTPLYLLVMLGAWCYNDLPGKIATARRDQAEFLSICLIGTVLIALLLLINLAGKRWKAESRDTSQGDDLPPITVGRR
jgi:SNF family Na+-dependent transporter